MIESTLQVGDFARNTIHGYITYLLFAPQILFYTLIVDSTEPIDKYSSTGIQLLGHWRIESPIELEKVPASISLIEAAKTQLAKLNADNKLDNLSYIQFLNKLNEQEKDLQIENKL